MPRPTAFMPPVKIIGAEIDDQALVVTSEGQLRHDTLVFIAETDGIDADGNAYVGIGAIRSGRYCAKCLEPQDVDLPEACWVCKFPMRERQGEFLEKGYRGNIRVGPSSSLEDEYALMDEFAERHAREQRDEIFRPRQIILPGDKGFGI